MKVNYEFSNCCGTVYKKGNVVFSKDGDCVISPVGNRVTIFDLVNHKSTTLPCENRKNIERLALSPSGNLLLSIDDEGNALLININKRIILCRHNFKGPVKAAEFSPCGKWIAISHGNQVQIWRTPGFTLDFQPFVLFKVLTGHYDEITCLSWSFDSKFIVTGSKDMTARVHPLQSQNEFYGAILSGHREKIMGCWFSDDLSVVYTISKDGALYTWTFSEETANEPMNKNYKRSKRESAAVGDHIHNKRSKATLPKWKIATRNYFNQPDHAKVSSCHFHQKKGIMLVGFESGVFGLWEMPDFINIHTMTIAKSKLTATSINADGEWLVFGCAKTGQLMVWEWQSETFVMKQTGHKGNMSCISYSQDGQHIATGGDDGLVHLWNTSSGFCVVSFEDHEQAVTGIQFARRGQVIFSSSLDGTVRAFDLIKFKNFRVFAAEESSIQFSTLAVDPSGEIVCAAGKDDFQIYMWSVQTGKLINVLAGHGAPISSLTFASDRNGGSTLVSSSWDKTVRLWNVLGTGEAEETFDHQSEIVTVAASPDGKYLATSTLDGHINFWDVAQGKLIGSIDGKRDLSVGRKSSDRRTADSLRQQSFFTSLTFSNDGLGILASGKSRHVCLYDFRSRMLLKRFTITSNQSLDGIKEMLNSKNMSEGGPLDQIDETGNNSDLEDRLDKSLPGARRSDKSERQIKDKYEVNVKDIEFAPSGRSFGCATTEGLLIFSLDDTIVFDPYDLEIDITPDTILEIVATADYTRALVMALRLGESSIVNKVYNSIPIINIPLVARDIPKKHLERMLWFIVTKIGNKPFNDQSVISSNEREHLNNDNHGNKKYQQNLQLHMLWSLNLLKSHAEYFRDNSYKYSASLRGIQKGLTNYYDTLSSMSNFNTFTLDFLRIANINEE